MIKNIFVLVACVALFTACQSAGSTPDETTVSGVGAQAFVSGMGIGINIGNTLDSIGINDWLAGETGWGNPRITKEFIQALKGYGYKSIRLPVTWAENMGPAPDFAITPTWMDRVEEVVNWILAEDMYCILNLHHDGGESDKSWILKAAEDPDGVALQFATVWKQIAGRFSGASDKLVFEAMNEVGFNALWDQWNPAKNKKAEAFRILNLLNQTFVDTVRASTANNQSRYLLISGYYTDIDNTSDPLFQMPKDTIADHLILSVHYYTPAPFCIIEEDVSWAKNREDWGSASTLEADRNELYGQFDKLKANFIDKGIPVILGEYGVASKNKVEAGRVRWMSAVTQACLDNGICPVLWDTGNDIKRTAPYAMSAALTEVWKNVK